MKRLVPATALLTLTSGAAWSQSCPVQALSDPAPIVADGFGASISVDGDLMAIGVAEYTSVDGGHVVLFERLAAGWAPADIITSPAGASARMFGAQLDLEGDTLAIADPDITLPGGQTGATYVFRLVGGSWSLIQTLLPATAGTAYGKQVVLTPDEVIVSAPQAGSGQLHVYDRTTFAQSILLPPASTLTLPGGIPLFGMSLAADGDSLFATVPYLTFDGGHPTRIATYDRQGGAWVSTGFLEPGGGNAQVTLDGDRSAIVGWYSSSAASSSSSEVSFLRRVSGAWTITQQSTTLPDSWFRHVDLVGDKVALAQADSSGNDHVEVWQLVGSSWEQSSISVLAGSPQWMQFGLQTHISAGELFVSDRPNHTLGLPGTVHVYRLADLAQNTCLSTPNSTGFAAIIGSGECNSVAANDLVLTASPVPDQPGLFYYGPNPLMIPFGNGMRCVGGVVARLPVTNATSGVLTWSVDMNAAPNASTQITAGSTWLFQAWFRDPAAGGAAFNLSDARQIEFLP